MHPTLKNIFFNDHAILIFFHNPYNARISEGIFLKDHIYFFHCLTGVGFFKKIFFSLIERRGFF